MPQGPLPPDDDDATLPAQDPADSAAPPSLFSQTRASRIRRATTRQPGTPPASASAPTTRVSAPPLNPTLPIGQTTLRRQPMGPHTYAHLLGGLCYLGAPIIPAIVLFRPASHGFARFHALQALALFVVAATLGLCLSLFTPTNVVLGILFTLLVIAVVVLALLWMAAAIAAFEGVAIGLPLLDRLITRSHDLEEDQNTRSVGQRARLELAIAAGVSVVLLILTFALPVVGWFGALSAKNLTPLGLPKGLPAWMLVSALLESLIVAAISLIVLAVFLVGLRKGKFFPSVASGVAIVGTALMAAGAGLLIADTLQRAVFSQLTQQFDSMVNSAALPKPKASTAEFAKMVIDGRNALTTIANAQHALLLPGAILVLLGIAILLFLLSQIYYKK